MFKKPLAHQSNATPLRSSARRALVSDIFIAYPSLVPSPNSENASPEEIGERDKAERELGRAIMPDGIRICSFETSGGVEGNLYLSLDNLDPLWMSFGRNSKDLIPTLYCLSKPPTPFLPIIKLHHPLPPPLLAGAPLFIGAVRDLPRPHLLPDVPEGGLVAFVVAPHQTGEVQYAGVGRLVAPGGMRGAWERRARLRDDEESQEGKFCEVLCIIGDHLWEMGSKAALPTFELQPPLKPLVPLMTDPFARPSPAPPTPPSPTLSSQMAGTHLADSPTSLRADPLTPSEISTLLSLALYQSLSTSPPTSFPIPASTLYSAHILPNRPAYVSREQREDAVIGKSDWKKLGKWMKELGKEGVLRVKDNKGEVTVLGFDANHPSIQSHAPFLTIHKEDSKLASKTARETAAADLGGAGMVATPKGKQLAIEELWRPAGAGVAFWEACGVEKSSLNPSQALKTLVEDYIAKHRLQDPANPRFIRPDDVLAKALGIKLASGGEERLQKDEILKRLKAGVAWSVSIGGQVKKGALQPIVLGTKLRQGRKTVTVISGLEGFGIDVDEFAEEMRKLCAGSASISPLSGASPKLNLKEVAVQGTQIKNVTQALVSRGVPRRWIKEEEGPGKKK